MGLMGYMIMVLFGFLSNFMIFSLFFEVRKKPDVMGLFGLRIRFQHARLHIVKCQVPANKISIFFVELCNFYWSGQG